jgi:cell division septal protein FtsQ
MRKEIGKTGLRLERATRKKKAVKKQRPSETGASALSFLGRLSLKLAGRGVRLLMMTLAALLSLVTVSVLLVSAYLYVSNSDYFAIKHVTISGIDKVSRDEILAVSGLDAGSNILTFDADEAEMALGGLPWLDQVQISKMMPDSVMVEVQEYQAKALVSLGRLYYMDKSGVPFRQLLPGENPELPIVSGFSEDELLNPGPVTRRAVDEIFWLVEALSERNDDFSLDNVSEINYDMVRGLTLFTKNRGLEVKIGFGAYTEKFRRLGRVLAHLKQRGKYEGLAYLNLEASPRVTVRYGANI